MCENTMRVRAREKKVIFKFRSWMVKGIKGGGSEKKEFFAPRPKSNW
jgi:hypothetical protein